LFCITEIFLFPLKSWCYFWISFISSVWRQIVFVVSLNITSTCRRLQPHSLSVASYVDVTTAAINQRIWPRCMRCYVRECCARSQGPLDMLDKSNNFNRSQYMAEKNQLHVTLLTIMLHSTCEFNANHTALLFFFLFFISLIQMSKGGY
jgi:hypothetical protein